MSEPLQLDPRRAPWLADRSVRRILGAFTEDDAPRFVGGCVRNALIDGGPTDLDIAVRCPPETTIQRLEAAGLKAIPTGVEHGTVTTVTEPDGADATAKGAPIEVTTLRQDVETDGRRAVVAFTRDWTVDAMRRDFTINALYAGPDGRVIDPLGGGVDDLNARRVRFIGEAEMRMREDYLRLLRFFRFFAWYGAAEPEDKDLDAIRMLRDGVRGLARERIGAESRKLFAAPDPTRALNLMSALGADAPLYGAPLGRSIADWRRLIEIEAQLALRPSWMRRLLFAMRDRADELRDALRLSKTETHGVAARVAALDLSPGEAAYRHGFDAAVDASVLRIADGAEDPPRDLLIELRAAAEEKFPMTAKDLIASGVAPGPELGKRLKEAEAQWIANGFVLEKGDTPPG